jgi:hypothetical protein
MRFAAMQNARKNVPTDQPTIAAVCVSVPPERIQDGNADGPNTQPAETDIRIVADGQIRTTPQRNGRLLVEIGRGRYVKRFNLSRAEAEQLAPLLASYLAAR